MTDDMCAQETRERRGMLKKGRCTIASSLFADELDCFG
jgi:hypothetical protein